MRLDPKKTDFSRLVSLLKKLAAISAKADPKAERNWVEETIKTLQAGKLEDFDLTEFVTQAYETDLAKHEDKRPVWDYGQAVLAICAEMESLGLHGPKTQAVRDSLKSWKQDASL
ncbi:MAG: hypothetical protein HY077_00525 [Elusimicrobia bacterium]|nr:hypothetical protein [Elusimicrobiota bacterium]